MTTVLYKKMLREWNKELRKGNRKILLLVDNCPSHSSITLDCIRVEFLPPNTTSVLQPMDMGVIKCLKCQYRKLLVMKILENIERNVLQTNITVLDAIIMLKKGWDAVSTSTIANCFIHADLSDRVVTSPDEDVFSDLQSMLPLVVMSSNSITPNEYIDIDKDIHTSEVLSDSNIVNMIINEENDDVNDEDNTAFVSHISAPSLIDARAALHTQQTFCMVNSSIDYDINVLTNLERKFETELLKRVLQNCTQKTLDSYCVSV